MKITITRPIPLFLAAWVVLAQSPAPIAIVGGQPIHEKDIAPHIQGQLRDLRNQEYQIKSQIVEGLINQKLVAAEAEKRGLTVDKLMAEEVEAKVADPTDGEVEAFYLAQKDRINSPLESVKAQLRQNLKQARMNEARQDLFKRLRAKSDVTILLRPPKTEVTYDDTRLKGDPNAPITIVEFSDFQCPYCQRAQATLDEVMTKYGNQVKLAFRDYPLTQIHPQAHSAAEASRCAADQGKFWLYHDALWANFGKLDTAALAGHAKATGLDESAFQACLAAGKHKAAVASDLQDGTNAGVTGTPAFFINGVFLNGAQPLSAFEKIIDEELASLNRGR
jgi:protein-disulfide isomerase